MWYYNVALLSNIKSFNINQRIEWCLVFKALLFHIYFLPKFMWPISLDLFLFSRTSNIWYPLFIHFVLLNICSLVPWRHQMYLLYIEKNPQNTLVCFEPESNLKTKKNKTKKKKIKNNSPQHNLVQYQCMMCNYIVISPFVVVLLH